MGELIPNEVIAAWMADVASGKWSWHRNTRCKYVIVRLDTRRGAYLVEDRDGYTINAETLLHQNGRAA